MWFFFKHISKSTVRERDVILRPDFCIFRDDFLRSKSVHFKACFYDFFVKFIKNIPYLQFMNEWAISQYLYFEFCLFFHNLNLPYYHFSHKRLLYVWEFFCGDILICSTVNEEGGKEGYIVQGKFRNIHLCDSLYWWQLLCHVIT